MCALGALATLLQKGLGEQVVGGQFRSSNFVLGNNIKMCFFSYEILACKIAALTVAPEIQHHPQKKKLGD